MLVLGVEMSNGVVAVRFASSTQIGDTISTFITLFRSSSSLLASLHCTRGVAIVGDRTEGNCIDGSKSARDIVEELVFAKESGPSLLRASLTPALICR